MAAVPPLEVWVSEASPTEEVAVMLPLLGASRERRVHAPLAEIIPNARSELLPPLRRICSGEIACAPSLPSPLLPTAALLPLLLFRLPPPLQVADLA